MTQQTQATRKQQVEQGAKEGASTGMWLAMRIGYMAKGLVYAIVGVLAFQVVIGTGGRTTGSSGALRSLVGEPFGQTLLVIVGIGLVGYSIWRFIQAGADPDNKGNDAGGIGNRLGYAVSGVIYGSLALTAFSIVFGSFGGGGGSGSSSTQGMTAQLMQQPFGRWLVGIVGLVVIGFGLTQFYKGFTAEFRKKFDMSEMSGTEQTWATRAGRLGLIARGVVLAIIGGFFLQAAYQAEPSEARGLGAALSTLLQQPFGLWLLGIVAIGLIAYGAYMWVLARYRRIPAEGGA
jgi:hypothetical protein